MRGKEQFEKTILVKGHNQDILKNPYIRKQRKQIGRGIDMRLYTVDGSKPGDKDAQTVLTFCSNMINPDPVDQKGKKEIDSLISSAFDKILISDNVKSSKDYNRTKSSVVVDDKQIIETNLTKLENTELDSYIKRATEITRLKNGDKFGRIY